ncbi:hypothetical protein Sango_1589700 [Sesamum angolense]|uniref:Reverse transcriptase domain-containing protein n=1 Tax=Sesamum angolense TaxID=2727404 RepID=A0AAE1WQD0_9LAMI|nr:hypothetical protein Sango_1589700 [Sesamum angolense]
MGNGAAHASATPQCLNIHCSKCSLWSNASPNSSQLAALHEKHAIQNHFPAQSTFIPGRLITDNVLAAFEINHYVKQRTRGKEGHFALKLDMSKAYDRVVWDFLRVVLPRLEARDLLVSGCRWEIRSGKDVRTWGDRWLPRPTEFRICSWPRVLDPGALVAELIDEESRCWKEELMQQVVDVDDANLIMKILLTRTGSPDTIIWHYTRKGDFFGTKRIQA